jgi:capsule polysaccharide export protein KpsE/RkpR
MTNAQLTLSKTKDKVITTYKKVEEKLGLLFIVVVIIPTLCSIIYFGFWASDVYISQSQFVIRTAQNPNNPSISDYTSGSFLTTNAVLQDSFSISNYMTSMDGLIKVNKVINLVDLFTSKEIDVFNRFASFYWNRSLERLLIYFNKQVSTNVDPISFITTVEVRSFTPESAQIINNSLIDGGETLVNLMNQRVRNDLIKFSEAGVKSAKANLQQSEAALLSYKNSEPSYAKNNLIANFQALILERDTAERQLGGAIDALRQAQMDAQHKMIYLEIIVSPNKPTYPLEPRRFLGILCTLIISLMIYAILRITFASVLEHID